MAQECKKLRVRWYVGSLKGGNGREAFKWPGKDAPTADTCPRYSGTWGPFRSKAGALFAASEAGWHNPHCRTISDAQRLAKLYPDLRGPVFDFDGDRARRAIQLAEDVADILYYDSDLEEYDPEKEWDTDTLDFIAEALQRYGFKPEMGD